MGDVHRLSRAEDLSLHAAPDAAQLAREVRPWRRALAWLLFLGPFFFASYGLATWVSSQRVEVSYLLFAWERHIPLLPWTIVPYWSIDLLYGISLFLCRTRRQLDTHAWRLLLTQLLAVACFLLFPLRCTLERGQIEGALGWMFAVLMSFDQPYNQAPSLHVALLVILLEPYLQAVPRAWRWLPLALASLIAVSVLTTWQHHFFDVPTGLWLGCFVCWILPSEGSSPLRHAALRREPGRQRLALFYAIAALGSAGLAIGGGGVCLWLLWGSGAFALVAAIYLLLDASAFAKQADGSLPFAVGCLFAPYLLGAWLNSRWWTRRLQIADRIAPGVLLGRLPTAAESRRLGVVAIVDVCAELPCRIRGVRYTFVPMLDLVLPDAEQLERAVAALEEALAAGPVLVCCALGFARSALVVAAWLLRARLADSPQAAVSLVRQARPAVALAKPQIDLLRRWQQRYCPRRR